MTKPSVNRVFALIMILLMFIPSCIKDDMDNLTNDNWKPELALPLINSRFGIDRIISKFETDGFLTTDEQDVVTIVYQGKLFEYKATDLFKLEDVSFDLALLHL